MDGGAPSSVGSVNGVETPSTANGGRGSKVYQKCLYIIVDVAVFDPFFFHSLTCARPRKMSCPGT